MFQATTGGQHTIIARAPGYVAKSLTIIVNPPTSLLQAPETISRKKLATLMLSRDTDWAVQWQKGNESSTVATGAIATVTFTPDKNGIYTVLVRNKPMKSYELKGFTFGTMPSWAWYAIIIIIVLVIIIALFRSRGGGGGIGSWSTCRCPAFRGR